MELSDVQMVLTWGIPQKSLLNKKHDDKLYRRLGWENSQGAPIVRFQKTWFLVDFPLNQSIACRIWG